MIISNRKASEWSEIYLSRRVDVSIMLCTDENSSGRVRDHTIDVLLSAAPAHHKLLKLACVQQHGRKGGLEFC